MAVSTQFAYVYFMTNDFERIREVAPAHVEHWHGLGLTAYQGGPFADRSGGLITFEGQPIVAERAVADDPFVVEGLVARSYLKEWRPER